MSNLNLTMEELIRKGWPVQPEDSFEVENLQVYQNLTHLKNGSINT